MPNLYDLLATSLGGNQDALNQDPLYQGAVAEAGQPLPSLRFRSNADAILGPLTKGLMVGALSGFGKREAYNDAYSRYSQSPLIKALQASGGGDQYGQDSRPASWTPQTGQQDALMGALQLQTQQAQKDRQTGMQDKLTEALLPKVVDQVGPSAAANAFSGATDSKGNVDFNKLSTLLQGNGSGAATTPLQDLASKAGLNDNLSKLVKQPADIATYLKIQQTQQNSNNTDLDDYTQKKLEALGNLRSQANNVLPIINRLESSLSPDQKLMNLAQLKAAGILSTSDIAVLQASVPAFSAATQAAGGSGRFPKSEFDALNKNIDDTGVIANGGVSQKILGMANDAIDSTSRGLQNLARPGGKRASAASDALNQYSDQLAHLNMPQPTPLNVTAVKDGTTYQRFSDGTWRPQAAQSGQSSSVSSGSGQASGQ